MSFIPLGTTEERFDEIKNVIITAKAAWEIIRIGI